MGIRSWLYWKMKELKHRIRALVIKAIIPHVRIKAYFGGVYALDDEIVITKTQERILHALGFIPHVGCWAACGYGWIERKEEDGKVRYKLYDCMCHPGQYAIFF